MNGVNLLPMRNMVYWYENEQNNIPFLQCHVPAVAGVYLDGLQRPEHSGNF